MRFICTCEIAMERIAESHLSEQDEISASAIKGIAGLLLVDSDRPDAHQVMASIPEINSIIPIDVECPSELMAIAQAAAHYVDEHIAHDCSIAIRVRRRGQQGFSSVEVVAAIADRVKREINLQAPDYALRVELIRDRTYIGLQTEDVVRGKARPSALRITSKLSVVQLLYADQPSITEAMGHRIGRAAQAFSIRELILAHEGEVDAEHLGPFCQGAYRGRNTRLKKVRRIRGESTRKVPIKVGDFYQTVRRISQYPLIITSAAGTPIAECSTAVRQLLIESSRFYVLIGSRQGIPRGVFRRAELVVNLAPGLTFATEHGVPSAVAGLLACLDLEK